MVDGAASRQESVSRITRLLMAGRKLMMLSEELYAFNARGIVERAREIVLIHQTDIPADPTSDAFDTAAKQIRKQVKDKPAAARVVVNHFRDSLDAIKGLILDAEQPDAAELIEPLAWPMRAANRESAIESNPFMDDAVRAAERIQLIEELTEFIVPLSNLAAKLTSRFEVESHTLNKSAVAKTNGGSEKRRSGRPKKNSDESKMRIVELKTSGEMGWSEIADAMNRDHPRGKNDPWTYESVRAVYYEMTGGSEK